MGQRLKYFQLVMARMEKRGGGDSFGWKDLFVFSRRGLLQACWRDAPPARTASGSAIARTAHTVPTALPAYPEWAFARCTHASGHGGYRRELQGDVKGGNRADQIDAVADGGGRTIGR
jgi:hypothetical protein